MRTRCCHRWGLFFLAIGLLAASLWACGRKTLPIPPQDAIPAAITDLRYHQDENNIVLTWTYPKQTTVGSSLQEIDTFQIYRAVVPESEYCAGCPVPFSSAVELRFEEAVLDPKKRLAQYTETLLRPGHRYVYKVITKAGWRLLSDDSNLVSLSWDSPTEAPTNLVATAGDRQVTLAWQPATRLLNGEPLSGPVLYQVYRGPVDGDPQPVGEPVAAPSYTDSGLLNGKSYRYEVRALLVKGKTRIIGLASRAATATPKDLTAPLPPRNLNAVKMDNGVKLIWDGGTEKDLAGYRIYRRLPSQKELTRIGQVDGAQLSFKDLRLPEGQESWFYAVSAFDQAEPANESPVSKEVFYESF